MSKLYNRLNYILGSGKSLNQVSKETEIPYSTLWYYQNGQRNLPDKYENSIYNMYTRTSYAKLKEAGLNATQANRFRWYAPDSVIKIETQVTEAVLEYSKYALGQKAAREGIIATEDWIAQNIDDYMTKIKKNFSNSPITKEEYVQYLDKLLQME